MSSSIQVSPYVLLYLDMRPKSIVRKPGADYYHVAVFVYLAG